MRSLSVDELNAVNGGIWTTGILVVKAIIRAVDGYMTEESEPSEQDEGHHQ